MRSNADSTASASHPLRNASRRAFDRAGWAARSGPYQCQLCPRPPPRPFALIPARFCDCVPATTYGRPAMLDVARTQIGLSHTSWIATSESVNCRPTSSTNAYRMRAHDSLPNKSQSIFEAIGAFLSESEKSANFEFRSGLLPSSPRPQYLLSTICGAPAEGSGVEAGYESFRVDADDRAGLPMVVFNPANERAAVNA